MLALKSSLTYMRTNNPTGKFDSAIDKYRRALRFFMTGKEFREELPVEEDHAAAAA
jgi:hypothetical protein